MEKSKKAIAALTGVLYYLKCEAEQRQQIIAMPVNNPSNWSAYGRQSIMTNRSLIQRRVIKR